jgi:DNA repair photolyase
MKAIYEPAGAAKEYAPLAANLYSGCLHGCTYCYVPGCLRKSRADFNSSVKARDGILQQLEKDADRMVKNKDGRRVLFSFTSDPYQPFPEGVDITRQALQVMVDRGLNFEVCTKGGLRAERDFDLLKQGGRLGVSLVWGNNIGISKYEPKASRLDGRVDSLYIAHKEGIYTWLSVEPVIDPYDVVFMLRDMLAKGYVDEFRVGKINHDSLLERAVHWQSFTDEAYDLLLKSGKKFMFKESLKPYLGDKPAKVGYDEL